jgi:hypothetical protein
MKLAKKLTVATALIGVLAVANLGTLQAAETSPRQMTMKPMHGISFDFGTKHAVSYFLNEDGLCKVTLLVAEALVGDEVPTAPATRFEVAIDPNKTGRVNTAEGATFEFTCNAGAQAMTFRAVDQVVYAPPTR